MPGASFAALSRAIAAMWKKASSKTKSAVRKMVRSPMKMRKMRMSKKRALKKSGSPRRARKDKGMKRTGKANAYAMFDIILVFTCIISMIWFGASVNG
jgi:Flp pilus assembly protein TadB